MHSIRFYYLIFRLPLIVPAYFYFYWFLRLKQLSHCRTVSSGMREIQTCKIKKNQPETTTIYRKMPHKTGNYSKTGKQETFSVALSHCFLTRAFQNCATKNATDFLILTPHLTKVHIFLIWKKPYLRLLT